MEQVLGRDMEQVLEHKVQVHKVSMDQQGLPMRLQSKLIMAQVSVMKKINDVIIQHMYLKNLKGENGWFLSIFLTWIQSDFFIWNQVVNLWITLFISLLQLSFLSFRRHCLLEDTLHFFYPCLPLDNNSFWGKEQLKKSTIESQLTFILFKLHWPTTCTFYGPRCERKHP